MVENFNVVLSNQNNGDLGIPQIKPAHVIREHENSVDAVASNPKVEAEFSTGSHDKTIKVWDATKQKCLKTLKGHQGGVWCLEYSPDGKTLLSASPDSYCKLWDVKSGKCTADLKKHEKRVYYAVFDDANKQVASVGSDRMVCLWDLRKTAKPIFCNTESQSTIWSVDFSSDKKYLISTTLEGSVDVTDINSGKFIYSYDTMKYTPEIESNIVHCVRSVRGHPDGGNKLLIGTQNKLVHYFDFDPNHDFEEQYFEQLGRFEGHSRSIRHVETSSDLKYMLSTCEDHSLRLWDMQTFKPIYIFAGHTDLVSGGVFLNKNTIVSSSWDMRIKIWNFDA